MPWTETFFQWDVYSTFFPRVNFVNLTRPGKGAPRAYYFDYVSFSKVISSRSDRGPSFHFHLVRCFRWSQRLYKGEFSLFLLHPSFSLSMFLEKYFSSFFWFFLSFIALGWMRDGRFLCGLWALVSCTCYCGVQQKGGDWNGRKVRRNHVKVDDCGSFLFLFRKVLAKIMGVVAEMKDLPCFFLLSKITHLVSGLFFGGLALSIRFFPSAEGHESSPGQIRVVWLCQDCA